MASSSNALINLLISPAPGKFSTALLALRRWGRSFLKPVSIGMMVLIVLLNVRLSAGVDIPTLRLKVRLLEATWIAIHQHDIDPKNIDPHNIDQTAAAKMAIFTVENLASENLASENPYGLSESMTRYRLTRAQLLGPHSTEETP